MLYSSKGFVLLAAVGIASNVAHAVTISFIKPSGTKATTEKQAIPFQNLVDALYTTTIKILDKEFVVRVDTGSSDLWLDTTGVDISSLIQTGQTTYINYLDGTGAEGPIVIGNVTIGDFTFSTALISAPGSNATYNVDDGLIGVGLPSTSQIRKQLQGSSFNGNTALENLFAANPSLPTFMTFQLSRSEATGLTDGGVFTIGETDSNFSAILNAPEIPVLTPATWIIPMDNLSVNGQPVASQSKAAAILDTGTSLALIPKAYVDAIYGSVPGAIFNETNGRYTVPCDTKLNISFSFGGIPYPVHPIDVVAAGTDESGNILCLSAFGASSPPNHLSDGGVDNFLLGDSFLRNVYSLFAFGPETSAVNGTPPAYIQLLSTTNIDQAFSEFDQLSSQRNASLQGNDTSSGNGSSGNSTSGGGGEPNGAESVRSMGLASNLLTTLSLLSLGLLLVI